MVDSLWYTAGSDRTPLKLFLNIDSADTADDTLLDNFGTVANRIIDNEIFPHKDDIPETSSLTEDLQESAKLYVAYRYKIHNKEFEEAKEYKEDFRAILDGVVRRLIASNESRTKRVIVSKVYATEPLQSEPQGP